MEELKFDSVWMAQMMSYDAIGALSVIGHATKRIGLGTAVVPTYPRHPTALASQALTAAAASNNRFPLGIGLSHQIVIESMLGFSYAKPASHMREYLEVLGPLLRGETVQHDGEEYHVHGVAISVPGAKRVPLLVAALGPAMLKLTGELADGTITWMVGPKTMEKHIVPSLTAAARDAGKPAPIVVGGFPVVLTNKPDEARAAHREPADDLRTVAVVSRDARSGRRERSGGYRACGRRKLPARCDRPAAQHRRHGSQRCGFSGRRGGAERTLQFLASLNG